MFGFVAVFFARGCETAWSSGRVDCDDESEGSMKRRQSPVHLAVHEKLLQEKPHLGPTKVEHLVALARELELLDD